MNFLGCGGNRAESVMNFTPINTTYDGQQKKYLRIALELVNSTVKVKNSSFSNTNGAVIVKQCNATFLKCNFNGNSAEIWWCHNMWRFI